MGTGSSQETREKRLQLGGEERVTAILREVNVVHLEKPPPEGAICFDHLRPEVEEVHFGLALELHRAERGVLQSR